MNNKYVNLYVNFLQRFVDIKRPLKIVFDCSNGTMSPILRQLFRDYPSITTYYINDKSDGNFPAHGANPLEPGATKQLQKEVLRKKADIGVAFDGDGDRVVFIDNLGRIMSSYVIAYLMSLNHKPPFIAEIFTFKSIKQLKLINKGLFPSPVGTYFVKRNMIKKDASVGSEYSGHYFFRDSFYSDSGILTTLKVMNIISELPYSLANFYDFLPKLYSEQFNIQSTDSKLLIKKIKGFYKRRARRMGFIDGIMFDFDNWFFVVRPSNTEPFVRFFIGSSDKLTFKREVKKLKSVASRR